jgi:hypothetical protein
MSSATVDLGTWRGARTIRMSCGLKMAFPSRPVFDAWVRVWSLRYCLFIGGCTWWDPTSNHDPSLSMEDHAAQEPPQHCCTLTLGTHGSMGSKQPQSQLRHAQQVQNLERSGKRIVLLSIAGTCNDVRARIAVPFFRQVKL